MKYVNILISKALNYLFLMLIGNDAFYSQSITGKVKGALDK